MFKTLGYSIDVLCCRNPSTQLLRCAVGFWVCLLVSTQTINGHCSLPSGECWNILKSIQASHYTTKYMLICIVVAYTYMHACIHVYMVKLVSAYELWYSKESLWGCVLIYFSTITTFKSHIVYLYNKIISLKFPFLFHKVMQVTVTF